MPRFRLENERLLEVALQDEHVLARAGAMVAYEGAVKFDKALLGGEGLGGALKRKAASEGFDLMSATGTGRVFFAHEARHVTILPVGGGRLALESSLLLALDPALRTSTVFAGMSGATSGQGLFTTAIEGKGLVAIASFGALIPLAVEPKQPLHVDPNAFVGYSGELTQEFVVDANMKTLLRGTSGETYQLKFSGSGVVYVQPAERQGA